MNPHKPRRTIVLALALAGLALLPDAAAHADPGLSCRPMCLPGLASGQAGAAAPEARPLALSEVAVDGGRDTFTFATRGSLLSSGTAILLSAPDGSTMAFVRTRIGSDPQDERPPQVWRLDGTQAGGGGGWDSVGSLDGAPADGTWQWSIAAIDYYSADDQTVPGAFPDLTLSVAGKAARAGFGSVVPVDNNPQLWNWHLTPAGGTFQDSSDLGAAVDVVNGVVDPMVSVHPRPGPVARPDTVVDPQEDPANARYFRDRPAPPPLPSIRIADGPDGSTTAYIDHDGDGQRDPDEHGITVPALPDLPGGGEGGDGGGGGDEGLLAECPGWLAVPPLLASMRSGVDGCGGSLPHGPDLA